MRSTQYKGNPYSKDPTPYYYSEKGVSGNVYVVNNRIVQTSKGLEHLIGKLIRYKRKYKRMFNHVSHT